MDNDGGSVTAALDADAVGCELVRQYYTVLTEAPEHLWRFYGERSRYCRVDADGVRTSVEQRCRIGRGTDASARPSVVTVDTVCSTWCAVDRLLILLTGSSRVRRDDDNACEDCCDGGDDGCDDCGDECDDCARRPSSAQRFAQSFVVEFQPPLVYIVAATEIAFGRRPASEPPATLAQPCVVAEQDDRRDDHVRRQPSTTDQLFVGRLLTTTTAKHVKKTFGKYGHVVYARVMRGYSHFTGNPSKYNYAFVKFDRPQAVDAALADQPIKLCNGNVVNVLPSRSQFAGSRSDQSDRDSR